MGAYEESRNCCCGFAYVSYVAEDLLYNEFEYNADNNHVD